MKRLLSIIVSALVAVSFAGIVSAVDSPSVPRETMDTKNTPPADVPTDAEGRPTTRDTKKSKKRTTTKSKKREKGSAAGGVMDTEPHYGTPALGGPSGTAPTGTGTGTGGATGNGGMGTGGTGGGGAGTGGGGR